MVLRKLRRRLWGDRGMAAGGRPTSASAREMVVFVNLSDSSRKHMCSREFVSDLCKRVMRPALEELDGFFGESWGSSIEPWLVLEGPALTFKITIMKLPGWELAQMAIRITEVFDKYWELEIDRVPPR